MKRLISHIRNALHSFRENRDGTVAIIFGLTSTVLILCTGLAIDYSRAASASSTVADALDAAALTVGRKMFDGERDPKALEAMAKAIVESNIRGQTMNKVTVDNLRVLPDFKQDMAVISLDVSVPTTFLKIAKYDSFDFTKSTETRFDRKKIELAMMLDVTGSMDGQKMYDLKKAAKAAIDVLMPKNKKNEDVRISLAPYSNAVNAGSYAELVSNDRSDGCVVERAGRHVTDDASARRHPLKAFGRCTDSTIEPLTNKRNRLKRAIDNLEADGATAGHLGIAWSWYTLSPKWKSIWPSKSKPAAYGEKNVDKIALLMTDGEFNTYDGVLNDRNASYSEEDSRELCKNMRKKNIKIYAVAFQAPEYARRVLKDCVSEDWMYFDANNGEELEEAFTSIAVMVADLRLSK